MDDSAIPSLMADPVGVLSPGPDSDRLANRIPTPADPNPSARGANRARMVHSILDILVAMNARLPHRHTLLTAVTLGLCALAPLAAQRTWIVDAAGGPGSDFTTIEAAVSAAAAGDRVRVLAGSYRGASIDKPIAVVGDTGAEIAVDLSHPGFTLTGIAPGDVATLHGFVFPSPMGTALTVTNCPGRVVLSELQIDTGPSIYAASITDAAALTMDNCEYTMLTQITRSKVLATRCVFRPGSFFNASALNVASSTMTLVQSQVLVPTTLGIHAVTCLDSTIELRGTATQEIKSGYRFVRGGQIVPMPAIRATGNCGLIADPDVTLSPIRPTGFVVETTRELSWLTAQGGQIGSTVELNLGSQSGDGFAVFVGLPGPALPLASWGDVWLDTRFLLQIASGTLPASTEVQITRVVPNTPSFVGLGLTYQAVTGATPSLTNGASIVLFAQ